MKKINVSLLGIFVVLTSSLLADSPAESTSLSSASADYNGNTLVLKGSVVLDHGLGKMMAEQAFLEKQEAGKDFPFSFIRLQKDVHIELTEQAELKCESADFDFITLKGVLLPKNEDPKNAGKVSYSDNTNNVHFMSQALHLEMNKKDFDGKKTAYDLATIQAEGEVIVDYAKSFTLRADRALYEKANNKQIITAYPKDENTLCHLSHEGDEIHSHLVHLDLGQSRLSFQYPSGKLLSSLIPQIKNGEIAFNADQLIWDHLKNTLFLKGNVHLEESSIGTIDTDGVLQVVQTKIQGKRLLKSIRSQGKTVLKYEDPSSKLPHQLVTHGPFHLDREHMRIAFESPLSNGKVQEDKQLFYSENELSVYADKAVLEYALVNEELQPVSLLLKGNVRISSAESSESVVCGLSDRVVFSPATKTLILSADPNKKVLFWDEGQGIRVSSQEIHITQDPSTHKRAIKGVGNVKFAFSTEEDSLLHKVFPIYKVSHE